MPLTIAYWKIRGLAQPIRLLLEYTGTEYIDKQYEVGPAPDYSRECWKKEKFELGLGEWPNLPYMIDGDVKLVESNAILRYIARKHDMCGKTDEEKSQVDMLEMIVFTLRNGFVGLCYHQDCEKYRNDYVKEVKDNRLPPFSRHLGSKKWLCGDNLTYPDFHFFEMLDQHLLFEPTILDGLDNLKEYHKRFAELPAIKAYRESDRCMVHPVNNPTARWK